MLGSLPPKEQPWVCGYTDMYMCFQRVKGYQVSLPLRPSSCHQSLGSPG